MIQRAFMECEAPVSHADQFGRFRLVKRLDAGRGQAQVWLSQDRRLETEAALKIYALFPDPERARAQYQAEKQAMTMALNGLPRLRDAYTQPDGSLCLIRDYIRGRSFGTLVQDEGRLPLALAVELVRAATLVAHSLHSCRAPRAIGDLHPGNLVLDENGQVWCIDLGASRSLCPDAPDRADAPLATLGYAAPEQTAHVTVATDVWGLGALLYYLLTGTAAPTEGGQTAGAQLAQAVPNVPEGVASLVCRSLDPEEANRFETAKAMAEALDDALVTRSPRLIRQEDATPIPPLPKPIVREVQLADSPVAHALRQGEAGSLAWAGLSQEAAQLRQLQMGEHLAALDTLDIEPYAHQLETARRVLTCPTMRGGAILADEVGLGKTIEALIVLQELRLKGLVESALIITPPQGVLQWAGEARTRIRRCAYERGFRVYERATDAGYPWLIVSSAMLRSEAHCEALSAHRYDLVIADEAHTVVARPAGQSRPDRTDPLATANALGRAVAALRYRRLLLLTATPLRRRWRELYDLVSLIRPGFAGCREEFEERFDSLCDRLPTEQILAERRALRAQIEGVLIRHRRRDLKSLAQPTRSYYTLRVAAEADLGEAEAKRVEIVSFLQTREDNERVVIFTGSPAERRQLAAHLEANLPQRTRFVLEGDRRRRQQIGKAFAETPGALLIASDNGSEGMNWQCASLLIHADIPWNPCIWEQRIGRIYRLGQHAPEVEIVHVALEGSADEAVLSLYEQALHLFDLSIGEAQAVLDHIPDPAMRDMQAVLKRNLGTAKSQAERGEGKDMMAAIFDYSEVLRAARRDYDSACAESDILDALLGLEDYI